MPAPLIIIPSRLGALRLPRKPLALIAGEAMIVHVWRKALQADAGPVTVATDSQEIADAVKSAGGNVVLTKRDHASGSDRVLEAAQILDPKGEHPVVVNVQGDLPTLDPQTIVACLSPLENPSVSIATAAALVTSEEEAHTSSVVKIAGTQIAPNRLRALYFSRATIPFGDGPLFHHIGLYAFRRPALERFVTLPLSPLEKRERLEQLRALEDGMRIDVALVEKAPFGVDTADDLERARALLEPQSRP